MVAVAGSGLGKRSRGVAEHVRRNRAVQAIGRAVSRVGWPRILLCVAIVVWFGVLYQHVYELHDRFGTADYDLGIYDQAVWLLSRGLDFDTVVGLRVFGLHANVALFALVPFYWLGAGPQFLNLVMIGSVAAGALPVFAIARHHLKHDWYALALAVAYLLHFTNQWMAHGTFHPEVVAMLPFFMAYRAALRGRWVAYGLWLAFAVSWKEDIALAALMLGVLLLLRGHRRAGLWTIVASIAWFVIATKLIIPAFNPGGPFYTDYFGSLGDSPLDLARTATTNPTQYSRQLENANAVGYGRDLMLPYGFVPVLAPAALLIGLPQALINLLQNANTHIWTPRFHYAAMPLVAMTIAMVEGVARLRREAWRRFAVGWIAATALATTVAFGLLPVSTQYREGCEPRSECFGEAATWWPLRDNPRQRALDAAVATPPEGASVAASRGLVPHLAHRRNIYTFPNPWEPRNWFGDEAPDPDSVDWLVIDLKDPTLVGQLVLLDEIVSNGGWVVTTTDDDTLVAFRLGAPQE